MFAAKPRVWTLACASAALALAGAPNARAQGNCSLTIVTGTCTVTTGATIQTSPSGIVALTVSPTATTLAPPSAADFNSGTTPAASVMITVATNNSATVTAACGQPTWAAIGSGASASKACADLEWSADANTGFTALTTSGQTVVSAASPTNGTSVSIFLRARLTWTADTPGTYSMPVKLSIAAP